MAAFFRFITELEKTIIEKLEVNKSISICKGKLFTSFLSLKKTFPLNLIRLQIAVILQRLITLSV